MACNNVSNLKVIYILISVLAALVVGPTVHSGIM